jgi:putative SOS response-associated peptidase YedK
MQGGPLLINARSETVTSKPAFRGAARRRRALLPANGYYEWSSAPGRTKRAFYLHPEGDDVIAFAGLYEWWRPPPPNSPPEPDLRSSPASEP